MSASECETWSKTKIKSNSRFVRNLIVTPYQHDNSQYCKQSSQNEIVTNKVHASHQLWICDFIKYCTCFMFSMYYYYYLI